MPAEAAHTPAPLAAARHFLSVFATPGPILVAVSGGSDSKGLLLTLSEMIATGGYAGFSLCACTVDHGLREASRQEAEAVAAFCRTRGIAHVTQIWDGDKPKTGLQAAARIARYRLLAQAARAVDACCIVTGHTAEDQAETVAMRALRGEGAGLAGMSEAMLFEQTVWVVRPFLPVARGDIRAYLRARGEDWFEDPSNADPAFERVRIRTEITARPAVPGDILTLAKARNAAGARIAALLSNHVTIFSTNPGLAVDACGAGAARLPLAARLPADLARRFDDPDHRRALLILAATIGGRTYPVGADTAARIAGFLRAGALGRITASRVVFDLRKSGLYLYREARGLAGTTVASGGSAVWDGRFRLINRSDRPLRVQAGQALSRCDAAITAGLPPTVAWRAASAGPSLAFGGTEDAWPEGVSQKMADVAVTPLIAPYDTFLPRFDLRIANALAVLFGRKDYLFCPVHDVSSEKAAGE